MFLESCWDYHEKQTSSRQILNFDQGITKVP